MPNPITKLPSVVKTKNTSLMPSSGASSADLPQLMDFANALDISNYIIDRNGRLIKRRGSTKLAEGTGSEPSFLVQYTDDVILMGYGTKLAALKLSDKSLTVIKDDFSGDLTDGVVYGSEAFVSSSEDNITRIRQALTLTNFDGDAYVGASITGGTSGATARVVALSQSIVKIDGLFVKGETITGGTSGATCKVREVAGVRIVHTSNPFGVGETLTGLTSGATGVINYAEDSGAPGVKWLDNIVGKFQAGEQITNGTATETLSSIDGGILALEDFSGTFLNGETVTGGTSGTEDSVEVKTAVRSVMIFYAPQNDGDGNWAVADNDVIQTATGQCSANLGADAVWVGGGTYGGIFEIDGVTSYTLFSDDLSQITNTTNTDDPHAFKFSGQNAQSVTLYLDDVSGNFSNGETVTDANSLLSAEAVGSNTFTTQVTDGPKCKYLDIFESRLIAGYIYQFGSDNAVYPNKVIASKEDTTGAAPYFATWTQGTNADSGFSITDFEFGEVTGLDHFDRTFQDRDVQQLVIFYKNGLGVSHLEVQDLSGVYYLTISKDLRKKDYGGMGRSISTIYGVFFGNDNGEFLLMKDGNIMQINGDISEQEIEAINNAKSSRLYFPQDDLLLVATSYNGFSNNIIYWYNLENLTSGKIPYGKLSSLSINNLILSGDKIYATNSTTPKILEIMPSNVYDDEGCAIYTGLEQQANLGDLESLNDLIRTGIGGFLHNSSEVKIDVYGVRDDGLEEYTGITYTWSQAVGISDTSGYDAGEYDKSSYDGSLVAISDNTHWAPFYGLKKCYQYQYYIFKISSADIYPHIISYLSMETKKTRQIRKNVLQ